MSQAPRKVSIRLLTAAIAAVGVASVLAPPASQSRAADLGSLSSQLSHEQARQQNLAASVSQLSGTIASLDSQVALVRSREAAVRSELDRDRAALSRIQGLLTRERKLIVVLRARLARAQLILGRQLVSSYEGDNPDLVSVVLDAHGFNDLLEHLDFLHRAEHQQQTLITVTRQARSQADAAEQRLAKLEATDLTMTQQAATRAQALAGMSSLLASKQAAVARARAAQQAALAASRAKGAQLQSAIGKLQAQQAAARAAASAAASAVPSAPAAGGSSSAAPSGGWAIPYAIVLCESGGQNLPPNSAGASGYYQILPSTWKLYGGSGPAAYLAGKSEQDAVASRIWNGGAGASSWVCAGIVGIH